MAAAARRKGVPLEEVESVDEIVKRFKTGAISLANLSSDSPTSTSGKYTIRYFTRASSRSRPKRSMISEGEP